VTSIVLPAERSAASQARHFTRDVLARLEVSPAVIDDAELLVSELVTNAVLHARSASRVDVDRRDGRVRVTVRDESPVAPQLRNNGADVVTGRGLVLVDRLARTWGVDRAGGTGKVVWFELDALEARRLDDNH
jgi:anti-sigma regulatory factor (Ser/Thr protein kinase)